MRRVLAIAVLLAPTLARAHWDPPGVPAMSEHIELTSVLIEDDGSTDILFIHRSGDIRIDTRVSQDKHSDERHSFGTYTVDDKDPATTTININQAIYDHHECNPIEEPIEAQFKITNIGTFIDTRISDISSTVPLKKLQKMTMHDAGNSSVNYTIMVSQEPSENAHCVAVSTHSEGGSISTGTTPSSPRAPAAGEGPAALRVSLASPHPFAAPGTTAEIPVSLTNTTGRPGTFTLASEIVPGLSVVERSVRNGRVADRRKDVAAAHLAWFSWDGARTAKVALAPGETAARKLVIAVPVDAAVGDYAFQVMAYGRPMDNESAMAILTVSRVARPETSARPAPGSAAGRAALAFLGAVLAFAAAAGFSGRRKRAKKG